MKIATKFCGGCNPRFERKSALLYLKQQISNHEFVSFNDEYDILILILGCKACKQIFDDLDAKYKFYITFDANINEIIQKIDELGGFNERFI